MITTLITVWYRFADIDRKPEFNAQQSTQEHSSADGHQSVNGSPLPREAPPPGRLRVRWASYESAASESSPSESDSSESDSPESTPFRRLRPR